MPRQARNKEKKLPHHIISRSIEEVLLFNTDEDKEVYLKLIEYASKLHRIEILSYCLMDNHVHILIHPRGGDISKFMHTINNSYAKYYNRINKRRGHLFSERFKNVVVKGLMQLLRNSTYIHNNVKDLFHKGFTSIKDYPYSSTLDYVEPGQGRGIATPNWIFSQMGLPWLEARNNYLALLEVQSQGRENFEECLKKDFNHTGYKTDKKMILRGIGIDQVIKSVATLLNINNTNIRHIKYIRKYKKYKALLAIILKIYCDLSNSEMTKIFRNHTSTTIGKFCVEGMKLLDEDDMLQNKIDEILIM